MKRVGILTGGGDCPGLNAVIRAVTKSLLHRGGVEVVGIKDGFEGLVEGKLCSLDWDAVSGILTMGGTILGTSNRANPFRYPVVRRGKLRFQDKSKTCINRMKKERLDILVCVGGDGTLSIANAFVEMGVQVIGVPKTIDNDLRCTDITFGFDTAVAIATEAIDRLHTTAQSHHRAIVVETMGRNAGWIALYAGVAGGGDIVLIPEIPFEMEKICEALEERRKIGRHFSIIVVGEGARMKGGKQVVRKVVPESFQKARLGGVSAVLADKIEKLTGQEARAVILGHTQRGGTPTAFDRVLATRFGGEVAEAIREEDYGKMVALQGGEITRVPLADAVSELKLVPPDHDLIRIANSVGTSFGV